jgi:hypothetical protein
MEKVNKETSVNEFERFCDTMCIDMATDDFNEEELSTFNDHKNKIVKGIMRGDLVISESGEPTYTPVRSVDKSSLTFHEPTGQVMAAMDKRGKNQDYAKMFESLGAMTKSSANRFAKMAMYDLKICQAIGLLFLV